MTREITGRRGEESVDEHHFILIPDTDQQTAILGTIGQRARRLAAQIQRGQDIAIAVHALPGGHGNLGEQMVILRVSPRPAEAGRPHDQANDKLKNCFHGAIASDK